MENVRCRQPFSVIVEANSLSFFSGRRKEHPLVCELLEIFVLITYCVA